MSLSISKKTIALIIEDEVSSEANYRQRLHKPSVPSNGSGVTIGIGYDLGMTTKVQFRKDWINTPYAMTGNVQVLLESSIGLIGNDAKKRASALRTVTIPWEHAYWVFVNRVLPRFAALAANTYPNLVNLNADTQGVILSLIYNRGASLTDSSPNAIKEQRRKEMRELATAIEAANYTAIATQLDSMKRLWDGVPDFPGDVEEQLRGLVRRREKEAAIVLASQRVYADNEIVRVGLGV